MARCMSRYGSRRRRWCCLRRIYSRNGAPVSARRVMIDGIEYVPAVTMRPVESSGAEEALGALLLATQLYSPSHGRDLWNTVWDALRALQPGIDDLSEPERQALWAVRWDPDRTAVAPCDVPLGVTDAQGYAVAIEAGLGEADAQRYAVAIGTGAADYQEGKTLSQNPYHPPIPTDESASWWAYGFLGARNVANRSNDAD